MDVDITAASFKRDPFPICERLRKERPITEVRAGRRRVWLVTRYDDAVALLKDERFVKDRTKVPGKGLPWMPAFVKPLSRNMLDLDDPDHRRLRALVSQAFTPRLVEAMRVRVLELTHSLLDQAAARGQIDLIVDFAVPIPTTIIAEMLGVPAKDRDKFHQRTGAIVAADVSPVAMLRALPAIIAFLRYLRRLIASKRADPADDLLSALIAAADESGDRLNEDELVAMAFLLLVAGHETTVNLIGNGILALIRHRDQLERLAGDPNLDKSAVEEMLRFDGPLLTSTERYAAADTDFRGAIIPAGATIYAALASANRDETAFEQPDRLNLARSPNRHLAFGDGMHFCAGAALARMEAQIAIGEFVRRFPGIQLRNGQNLRWKGGIVLHGLEALPLALQ